MADTLTVFRVGPLDNGKRMSFADFQRAEPVAGHNYELARGVIEVTDIPGRVHALILNEVRAQVSAYWLAHREHVKYVAGGGEAKTEMPEFESERHPDLSIYLTPMPNDEYPWDKWIASIVIEVVSSGEEARRRDYVTKRQEYLAAGVAEYWIVDPYDRSMLGLTRHGDKWREQKIASDGLWNSHLLPGFALDLSAVFAILR